jgi:NADPH:quinone reductase-like Zn-dependent oxidoreductase
LLSIGTRRRIRPFLALPKPQITEQLVALVRAGRIEPVIERTFPFDRADAALARVASGRVVGKVVVRAGA